MKRIHAHFASILILVTILIAGAAIFIFLTPEKVPTPASTYLSHIEKKAVEDRLKPNSTPSQMLDIFLIGIATGPKGRDYAIFVDRIGRQKLFRTGDHVFSLGILTKVEKDKVVVNVEGRDMEIPLVRLAGENQKTNEPDENENKHNLSSLAEKAVPATKALIAVPGQEIPRPKYVMIFTPFVKSIDEKTFEIDRRWIQGKMEEHRGVDMDIKVQPNYVNGGQKGLIIEGVKEDSTYGYLGLLKGDVFLRINDQEIFNGENLLQAMTNFSGMENFHFEIVRNGEEITLTYQMK